MKRLHVHLNVTDLDSAVSWYSALFAAAPTVTKPDYAKWMLDDPRVNFAISTSSAGNAGLSHLGIQAESDEELEVLSKRLGDAEEPVLEEKGAVCCYARSDKTWGQDPAGIGWELFHTTGLADTMGSSVVNQPLAEKGGATAGGCC